MIKQYLQHTARNMLTGVMVIALNSAIMVCSHASQEMNSNNAESEQAADADTQKQEAHITNAWARLPIPPGNNSAIYMQINNPTNKQITIIGASAPVVANNVELHKSFVDERGISRMVAIDKIVVPPQSAIELAPGAIHIMLFDLKRRLDENSKFKVTLQVEGGEHISSEVVVMNK